LNGIQRDVPLQIEQKLLISPGGASTGSSNSGQRQLSPIEQLTPSGDGRYYHTVKSGETLSFIAGLYKINLNDLMTWNGLSGASTIFPDQKLVLLVTPPATATATPGPTEALQIITAASQTVPDILSSTPTPIPVRSGTDPVNRDNSWILVLSIGMGLTGLLLIANSKLRRQ
jgi:LysM repeat protein